MKEEKKQTIDEEQLAQANGGMSREEALAEYEAMNSQNVQFLENFRADYKQAQERIDKTAEALREAMENTGLLP